MSNGKTSFAGHGENSISLPLLPVRSSPDDELVDEAYVKKLIKLFQYALRRETPNRTRTILGDAYTKVG